MSPPRFARLQVGVSHWASSWLPRERRFGRKACWFRLGRCGCIRCPLIARIRVQSCVGVWCFKVSRFGSRLRRMSFQAASQYRLRLASERSDKYGNLLWVRTQALHPGFRAVLWSLCCWGSFRAPDRKRSSWTLGRPCHDVPLVLPSTSTH